ncbi:MAG: cupin domain-containing protein [Methylotenera sp.]
MVKITVEKPSVEKLTSLGVTRWPIWSKEVSEFPWTYSSQEIAYILEGEVTVTPNDGGDAVSFGVGDLVTFPAGLSCTWHVKKALRKHYQFS